MKNLKFKTFSIKKLLTTILYTVIISVFVGTIIYIVAVQKNSKKKVIIELMFALAILLIMASILNAGYEAIVNKALNEITPVSESFYSGMEFNINNVLVPYIIIAVVVYIVNMIRQRMITNKLNKQLNKKTID